MFYFALIYHARKCFAFKINYQWITENSVEFSQIYHLITKLQNDSDLRLLSNAHLTERTFTAYFLTKVHNIWMHDY